MAEVVTTQLEVRWGECDPAGIVYHPAYIDWFSVARMHFLRENGLPYMEAFHAAGIVLVVLEVTCKYRKVLKAEDTIRVEARLAERTRTRMALRYAVFGQDGELCAAGRTEHAFVDMNSNRACNLERKAPDLWQRMAELPLSDDRGADGPGRRG
ncbi:MAG: acyl-CoA thioesterase [Alicyclobacillus sp.]|nr:acyl-CoA thioesterase [Alicyclobacillus sp.]